MVSLAYTHHVIMCVRFLSISAKHNNKTTAAACSAIFAVELYHLSFSHKHALTRARKSILHKDESTEKGGLSLAHFASCVSVSGQVEAVSGRYFWNSVAGSQGSGYRLCVPYMLVHLCWRRAIDVVVVGCGDVCTRGNGLMQGKPAFLAYRRMHASAMQRLIFPPDCPPIFCPPPWAFVHWTQDPKREAN